MARNRRSLTEEEAALWESVTRTARPLRHDRSPASSPGKATVPAAPSDQPAAPPIVAKPPLKTQHPPLGLGHIERRTARRIARGTIALDGRLDLHGMTQAKAHRRLVQFLSRAYEDGSRVVLIITGKGAYDSGDRGVLRRALPHWLEEAPLRGLVSGYDQAHRTHGGAGAYYVRLKRFRPDL